MTDFQEIGTVSTSDLCIMLGLTRSRVSQLVSNGIIPAPITRGRYDCISSVHAYIRFLNMKNDKQEIRQLRQNEYEYQRSRLIKARADTMELKRDLVERSLIPVSEANQVWELMIANCYLRGALVSDCAEILSKATSIQEVHHLLQIEIYKMLHDFANMEIDYAI